MLQTTHSTFVCASKVCKAVCIRASQDWRPVFSSTLPAFHLPLLHSKQLRCASEHLRQKWPRTLLVPSPQLFLYLFCTTLSQFSGTKCTSEEVNKNNCSLELNTKRNWGELGTCDSFTGNYSTCLVTCTWGGEVMHPLNFSKV